MYLDFRAAIAALGGQEAVFKIANTARASGDYLFNTLLPERNMSSYQVDSGSMIVRATMVGMVGMDSPYPPSGIVDMRTFLENTAKFANDVALNEATLRHLQDMMMRLAASGGNTPEALAQEALNFLDRVVIQPHLDRMEWLRGQALVFGAINWIFNGKHLDVNYGIPAANLLPARAAGDGYGGATSKLWEDVRLLRKAVRGAKIIAHPDTIDMARYNAVNNLVTIAESNNTITFRRAVNAAQALSVDTADNITFILYDKEGEVLNPANPSVTTLLPFMERGKLLAVGPNASQGYQPGQGSLDDDPDAALALGYTHIAPTIEGKGQPGRWARIFTPEEQPWMIRGQGVTNGIPVLQASDKVAVATTAMV